MEGVSRMRGAIESIKAVVTDTTLTAGASFGLALWSKGDNSKYTGWNYSKDHSRWCDEQNCMPVKVSTDGAAKIFEYLKKPHHYMIKHMQPLFLEWPEIITITMTHLRMLQLVVSQII